MYVKIFKTDIIVLLATLRSTLTNNFQFQSQLVDTDNITR
jgi:hypothetical protein